MSKKTVFSRRDFGKRALGVAAASAFPAIIPSSALGADGAVAPSNRVVVGCIGVGNRARYLLETALQVKGTQVVAVCDVKRDCREQAAKMANDFYGNTDCVQYNEHERIVERKDIDACIIGSCDHWHALHALAVTRSGKDCYVEKPLSVSMEQNRALRKAVRKHKTIFQFGTQQRSNDDFHRACELVRNGRIGKLKHINVWAPPSSSGGPTDLAPVPENLDYERWLGPAPFTPYTKDRETNQWWWFIEDYALGFIAGWGIHPLDIALWGADDLMRSPVEVEGTGVFPTEGVCNTAVDWKVDLRYDSGLSIDYRATPAPQEWMDRYRMTEAGHGTGFEGEDGWVFVKRGGLTFSSEEIEKSVIGENEFHLCKSRHHMQNYFDCVRSRKDPVSPIESAVESDSLCHISDIALRLQRKVRWIPKKERFQDDKEADARLTRTIREGWAV